ncbi:MAG: hypoxanthine phosphoribosyltransferase [Planctomycetota bacterium]|nr:MAG: hypoxanthine phosphoribosyltransferase [Planctomycetota bacterium]
MERFRRTTLLDRAGLARGLDELAARLRPRLAGREVTIVPILGGALVFAADLMRRLPPGPVLDFLRIQTYGDAMSPQRPAAADWRPRPENIAGRTVLLLDDILDTGRTMAEARRLLLEDFGAAEVLVVVVVDKPARRAAAIEADDCILRLEEDLFLVGYGLDLGGRFRNLPELLALLPDENGHAAEVAAAGAAPSR